MYILPNISKSKLSQTLKSDQLLKYSMRNTFFSKNRVEKVQVKDKVLTNPLCEKCPNTHFFLVRIFPYSVLIWENKDQKNSVFGYFSCSDHLNLIKRFFENQEEDYN